MKKSTGKILFVLLFIASQVVIVLLLIQNQKKAKSLTSDDYAHAEKFLSSSTSPLVFKASVRPVWIDENQFWYKNTIEGGSEFILVDAVNKIRERAFDHGKLANSLSALLDESYNELELPFSTIEFSDNMMEVIFNIDKKKYSYNINEDKFEEIIQNETAIKPPASSSLSPDGKKAVFIMDNNLWLKDLVSGKEKQLTYDGVEDFGYGTNNAGWTKSKNPVLLWSPDSKKIATIQHDGRGVGEMYLVSTNVGHPTLEAWKYPLPEDSVIFRVHRVIIDVENGQMLRLKMKPDQHRSTVTDHFASGGKIADCDWNADGSKLVFISTSRDHKHEVLRLANTSTGEVRDVFEETEDTFYESGNNNKILFESNEFIWYSQKSNWGHLSLHDLETGDIKNQITQGNWKVGRILKIDEEKRKIIFTASCREPGDPYFQYLYSINMTGSDMKLLTPDSANHSVVLSPSGKYFVDSYSTPIVPPVTVLRDMDGNEILVLEEADISKLIESGWQPPECFSVKARDGETDLYGQLFKPTNFNPRKKYPIINNIYPGPQSGSVGSRSFSAARGDKQALAELGFIVITLDAMGTPNRSKSYHEAYYGNMGDNGLPDHITGMKQLAERYSWIDIDKVGIYGHSGGGFASTDAILRYPDFFKVAVSGAGNHDNRNYEDDWGEKWQGLLTTNPDGSTSYDNQANQLLAGNLKGHLLLAHGTMDGNVPYYNTLLVVNELIAANKDFDLILFPNRGHGFGREPYMIRRRWDYFVKHLLDAEPPDDYEFKPSPPRRR